MHACGHRSQAEVSRVHHWPVKPITFKDDQNTAGAMICIDESGRDPRAELERLFELVRNQQARAKRGVVKHQELRTRRRAVDFAMGLPVVETTEVVSVRVREDVCTATSDEIVRIDGSPNKWLLHVDGLRQYGYKQKAHVCVRACVRARSGTCACVCVLC